MTRTLILTALLASTLATSGCGRRADIEDLTPVTDQPAAAQPSQSETAPAQ